MLFVSCCSRLAFRSGPASLRSAWTPSLFRTDSHRKNAAHADFKRLCSNVRPFPCDVFIFRISSRSSRHHLRTQSSRSQIVIRGGCVASSRHCWSQEAKGPPRQYGCATPVAIGESRRVVSRHFRNNSSSRVFDFSSAQTTNAGLGAGWSPTICQTGLIFECSGWSGWLVRCEDDRESPPAAAFCGELVANAADFSTLNHHSVLGTVSKKEKSAPSLLVNVLQTRPGKPPDSTVLRSSWSK
mmetsp:Transcript_19537/g.49025  ORF Transcript_19537/g.49025 Transcript_19537/m.49025 type:complete len:241 (-) Transcript_19537:1771-2493(-)